MGSGTEGCFDAECGFFPFDGWRNPLRDLYSLVSGPTEFNWEISLSTFTFDASVRALACALFILVAPSLLVGCGLAEFDEDIDTQFTVPKPAEGLFGLDPFAKTKRFKLGTDPADAERATFKSASIQVLAPAGADLSIMDRVEVHADLGGELTLLGEAEGFSPGEKVRHFDIVFRDDIRRFVTKDKRVVLVFVVFPSAFASKWPEDGITIRADVTVRVELL